MDFRIAICDDNKASLRTLSIAIESAFQAKGHLCTTTCFESGTDLLQDKDYMKKFDVFFLDIDMPGINGIQIAQAIQGSSDGNCTLVFVSNREDKVFESLKTQPLRFIRKRRFCEEIPEAVDAIHQKALSDTSANCMLDTTDGCRVFRKKHILYFESSNKVQRIITSKGTFETRSTLDALEQQFDGQGFLKVHRCYIVNLCHVQLIEREEILLDDGHRIPMSRRRRDTIMQIFQRWLFQCSI